MRIVAIGDNCVDIYTNLGLTFPGGGPVNFAVHAARGGARASYVGVIGADEHGRLIRSALEAEGVDTRCLRTADGPTAVAYVRLENGERAFVGSNPGVRYQLRVDDAVNAHLAGADLVHTTLDGRVEPHIRAWKESGLRVSFDFSHRYTPEQLELLPWLDLAFFSGQKIGPDGAEEAVRGFHARGPGIVVMTLGAAGALAFDGRRLYRQPAERVEAVDTLGAGDAFMAGFVLTWLRTGDIQASLANGAHVAAGVCTHYGGFGHGMQSLT